MIYRVFSVHLMLASISFIDNSLKDECSIKELIACLNSLEVMGGDSSLLWR